MTRPSPYRVRATNIDPAADNQIHDDEVAQRFGFSGALVPGVELFAYLTSPLVAAWGEPWLRGGAVEVRFRAPVYDGEEVLVTVDGDALTLSGPDGTTRATGSVRPPAQPAAVAPDRYPVRPLPEPPPPVSAEALQPGPLGTVTEVVDAATNEDYLDAVAEPLPLYRDRGLVHPGVLLRLVNAVLMRNVALGPWIHTGSRCRLLGCASVGVPLSARAVVTRCWESTGRSWVSYDALVLSGDTPVMQVDHTAIWSLG